VGASGSAAFSVGQSALSAASASAQISAAEQSSAPGTQASGSALAGASPPPKWLGKRVGRFRLIGLVGRGSMGKVFRAEDVQLHRLAALKVISSRSSRKKSAAEKLDMLLREARSAAKLEHPNIVSVYEVNSSGDVHFIAMELIEGGNLKDLVTAAGPLDVNRACALCADAADALQHAHEQGVVHRDVKPANLLLTRNGRCKLGDFGLARIEDAADALENDREPVGTPQFVAPEVVQGHEATALSDIYSLGGTLYYLLTGTPPFPGEHSREVVRKHVEEPPPDARTLRPEVPESLALAILRALSKRPTERFDSAGHFARVLRMHTIGVPAAPADDEPAASSAPAPTLAIRQFAITPRRIAAGVSLGVFIVIVMTACIVALALRGGDGKSGGADRGLMSAPPAEQELANVPLPRAGQVVQATETAALLRIARETDPAKHDGQVIAEGRVVRVELRRSENAYRIDFRGVDRKRGLACTFAPELVTALVQRLGGDLDGKLRGKRVQISGTVDVSEGQPIIEIRRAEQVKLVEP
jgi:serine/threonine-protein kinase